ncbi:Uncharacterised protein [Mycobacterium tuberculosis]|nr:Uncharacterised protein [Mycobacterium tuberculosis]
MRGDQVACRLRQGTVHLTQLSVQGVKLLHDLLGAGRVLARTRRIGGGERVTNDLHARLRIRYRMPNVRVDFAVYVLAQNSLRQQVHLTAMLRSARAQETVATACGHLLQGAGGDRDHGAVQFVLHGALGGVRAKYEPAVAGACRNIGVTCRKNLDVRGRNVLLLRQAVYQLLWVTTDRTVQGAARRPHRFRRVDRGGAQLNGVLAGITKRPRQVRMRLQG